MSPGLGHRSWRAWYPGERCGTRAGASLWMADVSFRGTVVVGLRAQVKGREWGALLVPRVVLVGQTKSPQVSKHHWLLKLGLD